MTSQVSSDNERDSNESHLFGTRSFPKDTPVDRIWTVTTEGMEAWFYDRSGMPLDM